jgi:hypothetical protein
MSSAFTEGDFVALTQLAQKIAQNSRQACGVHDELTREVTGLYFVLQRLQKEFDKPDSIISRPEDGRLEELQTMVRGCSRVLKIIDQVVAKYNNLPEEKRKTTRIWQKVRFGNGELKDLRHIRQELSIYTSALTLFLNLLSMGSQGRIEKHMDSHGTELRELRISINWITACLQVISGNRAGSIITSYAHDDNAIWQEFHRELLGEGFSTSVLQKHKAIIMAYVMELSASGALDIPMEDKPILEEQETTDDVMSSEDVEQPKVKVVSSPVGASTTTSSRSSSPCQSSKATEDEVNSEEIGHLSITRALGTGSMLRQENICQNSDSSDEDSDSDASSDEGGMPDLQFKIDEEAATETESDVSHARRRSSPNGKLRSKPTVVSIEDVEDEDFKIGAHPNCESVLVSNEEDGGDVVDDSSTGYSSSDEPEPNSPNESKADSKVIPSVVDGGNTIENIVEQFGFDPYRDREGKTRSANATHGSDKSLSVTGHYSYITRPRSGSVHNSSKPKTTDGEENKENSHSAIKNIVMEYGFNPYRSHLTRKTDSTIAVQGFGISSDHQRTANAEATPRRNASHDSTTARKPFLRATINRYLGIADEKRRAPSVIQQTVSPVEDYLDPKPFPFVINERPKMTPRSTRYYASSSVYKPASVSPTEPTGYTASSNGRGSYVPASPNILRRDSFSSVPSTRRQHKKVRFAASNSSDQVIHTPAPPDRSSSSASRPHDFVRRFST